MFLLTSKHPVEDQYQSVYIVQNVSAATPQPHEFLVSAYPYHQYRHMKCLAFHLVAAIPNKNYLFKASNKKFLFTILFYIICQSTNIMLFIPSKWSYLLQVAKHQLEHCCACAMQHLLMASTAHDQL